MRIRRGGFLVPMVLVVLTVAGCLLFALHSVSEQQNAVAHRLTDARIADSLAEAGLELLSTRIRESVSPAGVDWAMPLADGPLYQFFLLPVDELRRRAGSLDASQFDDLARGLFGDEWRHTLDVLESDYPGSSVELTMAVEPEPLYDESTGLRDPVEKKVRLVLRSTALYRKVSSSFQAVQELKVLNPLAPLTCKFTLFVAEAGTGDAYNVYRNHENGMPFMGEPQAPTVLFNTPANAVDDLTLTADNIPRVEAGQPFGADDDVRRALARRGFVFLGTTGDDIDLNLTAGPSLDDNLAPTLESEPGQFFHLYDPLTRNSECGYFFLRNPPDFFTRTTPEPGGTGVDQQPYVNFLYWGFHLPSPGGTSLRADGALGASLRREESSILHLFGTDNEPSRTLVYGPVYQDLIRFSYLAMDRDATDADEQAQLAAYEASGAPEGFRLSVRDTIDPVFRYVDSEADFQAEMGREAAGVPLRLLEPVLTTLTNDNFFADLNGDGIRQADEPVIDAGHPVVSLDPALYTYARMFDGRYEGPAGGNVGYQRFMSTVERIPYVRMVDYMVYCRTIPPEYHPDYHGLVAGGELDDYLAGANVRLSHADPLHDAIGQTSYYEGDLPDFFRAGAAVAPVETVLRARSCVTFADAAEFFESFPLLDGGPDAPKILRFNGTARILQGGLSLPSLVYEGSGAILLDDPAGGNLYLEGLQPLGRSILTLATTAGNVTVRGGLPVRALLVAPKGTLVRADDKPLDLGPGLALRSLPAGALTGGGTLRWDSLVDPTADDRLRGGYIDFYQMHASDTFLEWDRGGSS